MWGLNLEQWRTVTLSFVAVGQTCFVLVYWTFPWYKTFLGRALFYKAIMLAVIMDFFMITRAFDLSDVDLIFVILYGFLGIGVWGQFLAFLHVRNAGHQNQTNPNRSTRVSGNREVSLIEREIDAVEVSIAADIAEAAATETAIVAASVAEAAKEASAAEARARARVEQLGPDE